jgi:hypothetical protein
MDVNDNDVHDEHDAAVSVEPGGRLIRTPGGYPIALPAVLCDDVVANPPDGGSRHRL